MPLPAAVGDSMRSCCTVVVVVMPIAYAPAKPFGPGPPLTTVALACERCQESAS